MLRLRRHFLPVVTLALLVSSEEITQAATPYPQDAPSAEAGTPQGEGEPWNSPTRLSMFMARQIEDSKNTGATAMPLVNIAAILLDAGDKEQALTLLKQAQDTVASLRTADTSNTGYYETLVSRSIATIYVRAGEIEQAMKLAGEIERADQLLPVASALIDAGEKERAITLLQNVVGVVEKPTSSQSMKASFYSSIARALSKAGDSKQALVIVQSKITDPDTKRSALLEIIPDLAGSGNAAEVLDLVQKSDDPDFNATALIDISKASLKAGNNDQALATLEKATQSAQSIEVPGVRAQRLAQIASDLDAAGNQKRSDELRKQAVDLAIETLKNNENVKNPGLKRFLFQRQASTLIEAGESESALAVLGRTVELIQSTPQRAPVSNLISISKTMAELGDKKLALETLSKAAEAATKETRISTQVYRVKEIADVMARLDGKDQALDMLEQAFQLADRIERPNAIEKESTRASTMLDIAVALCTDVVVDEKGGRVVRPMKTAFTSKGQQLAKLLVEDAIRSGRIRAAREQLSVRASRETIEQLKRSDDPEIAFLAEMRGFRSRVYSAGRAGKEPQLQMIAELKALVGDRDFSWDAYMPATSLERAILGSDTPEIAAALYEYMGSKMSESSSSSMRGKAPMTFAAGRRLNLVGNPIKMECTTTIGEEFDWDAYRGKVVLIDFWAGWCDVCPGEHQYIKRVLELYADKGLAVVGVNLDSQLKACRDYIEKHDLPWTNLFSKNPRETRTNNPVANHYGITEVPTGILVDQEGNVVSIKARHKELDRLLRKLLGKPPGTPTEEEAIASLKANAIQMRDATLKGEYAKVIGYTHPSLVRLSGGPNAMVRMLEVTMTRMKNDGWTYRAYSMGEPKGVQENNGELFAAIPTTLTMAFPDGTIRTGGFLLGISEDDGRSWKFLDGQAIGNTPTRKRLLPDFPDDFVVDHDPSRNAATTGRLTFLLQSLRAQQERTKVLPPDLKRLGSAGKDSWGNDVAYTLRDADFELRSSGADGKLETSDDIVLTCPTTPKPQPKSGKPADDMPALGKTPTHIIIGQHKGRAKAADFSPDGQYVVSGGGTIEQFGEAVINDTASRKKLGDLEVEGGLHYLTDIAFCPRGQRIAAGSSPDRAVVVWDAPSKNVLQRLKLSQYPNDVAFSPDGSLLAVAESGYHSDRSKRFFGPCDVSIWNLGTGERTFALRGNSRDAHSVSFSPDGKIVASGGKDGSIRVWDLETGEQIRSWSAGASVADVVCLPDGNRVASTGDAGNVSIWQLKSGTLDTTLRFSGAKGSAIACDAQAGWIACADYRGIVRVWSNDGQLKFQFKAHDQVIQGLAFSGDGKRLVSASHDSNVKIWSMESDAEVEGRVSASDVAKVPAKDDEPKTTAEATNNE